MSKNRPKPSKELWFILAAFFIVFLIAFIFSLPAPKSPTYAEKLFNDSYVHKIEISIMSSDLKNLLSDPTSKTKFRASAKIDGEVFENIAFSTRGNASLYALAAETALAADAAAETTLAADAAAETSETSETSDAAKTASPARYSFSLFFDKFDQENTYYHIIRRVGTPIPERLCCRGRFDLPDILDGCTDRCEYLCI